MRHLTLLALILSLSGCAAGSPTSLGAFQGADAAAPVPATVIIERDVQLQKVGQVESAAMFERVFHLTDYRTVEEQHVRSHDYWIMFGPYAGKASSGQVTLELRTDDQGIEYQAPAWQVTDGYARAFGWLPIATSDQVVAGGVGTSFVLQVDRSDPKNPVSRVFLVNTEPGDKVVVTDRANGQSQTLVHGETKYVERGSAALSKKTLLLPANSPVKQFLTHVETKATTIGQP